VAENGPSSIALLDGGALRVQVGLQILGKLRHVGLSQYAGVARQAYQKTSMSSAT
jgi:hypothetical protein